MVTDFSISPQFRMSYLDGADLERKIDVFEDQTQGWLINQAKHLASNTSQDGQHAGYAVLALCVVYVESIACFLRGDSSDNKSREFFDFGLTQVFSDLGAADLRVFSKEFYRKMRCGLLHQGLPRGKIAITRGANAALAIVTDTTNSTLRYAVIDPWLFLGLVDAHFLGYVRRLKDPNETALRAAFETWFHARAV